MPEVNDRSHTITLDLNVTGYDGEDLDAVIPHFMAERDTNLTLSWSPAVEGPESFRLIVDIAAGVAAGSFLKTFVQELSKDLYQWSSHKLQSLFESKSQATGEVSVEFDDVTVRYRSNGGGDLAEFFRRLPDLLTASNLGEADEWRVRLDISEQEWSIEPAGGNQDTV